MNGLDRDGTDLSPYAFAGPALVALGYSAIPISPAEKMPGRYSGGQWWMMKDWSRYCAALPTGFNVTLWSKWPEANVGVAMGRGVLAFDIDQDFLIDPIKAVLPPCIVAKRGRKGETLFFRGDTSAIRSRGFKRLRPGSADPRDREGMMDLIADGKQTVVPPSIHPDTAAPYVWTTERTLLDTPSADLTEITVEHVEAVIEVLRAFGYEAPETIVPVEARGIEVADAATSTAEWFRKLNEDALSDLHAWVPRLGLTRLQRSGDGYRSVAEWRPSTTGKPLHKRNLYLSIDPKGIVDYGDCEKGYTALNLVMVTLGIPESDLTRAAVWLGEAIGYDFAPKMVLNRNRPKLSPREEAARLYNPGVRAILLAIDSPGGEAAGCAEFAAAVADARGRKPIVAYVADVGASAAYWIASACDRIICGPSAALGSIGVRMSMADTRDRDARSGVRRFDFVSSQSPFKVNDPATEDGNARIKARVDALAQVFVEAVADNRGVSAAQVLDGFGRGDVLIGAAAVAAGMADGLGTFESVLADLASSKPPVPRSPQSQLSRAGLPAPAPKAAEMPPIVPPPRQLSAAEIERIEIDYAVVAMLKARRLALGQRD